MKPQNVQKEEKQAPVGSSVINIQEKLRQIDEKNQPKKGRPFGNQIKKVKFQHAKGQQMVGLLLTAFEFDYMQKLNLKALYPESKDQKWDHQKDVNKVKQKLLSIAKTQKKLDISSIDEIAFAIAHFGGRRTYPYRTEFYGIIFLIIQVGDEKTLQYICSPQGMQEFPYFTLNLKGEQIKNRPTEEKIKSCLRFIIQRLQDIITKSFFTKP